MSFIPKPKPNFPSLEDMQISHAIVIDQFTGQEHHFVDTPFWEERKIADSLTRFFCEHPLRSGGLMHPAAIDLLEELGYVIKLDKS